MVRTPTLVGLAVLALLLASSTGAAQSLHGSAYASGSASANTPTELERVETAQTNELSASYEGEFYVDADAEIEMVLEILPEIALPEGDAPAPPVDFGQEPAEPMPEPEPAPMPQPTPEPLPIEEQGEIVASYDGSGSVDGSAYVAGDGYVAVGDDPIEPAPAPEPLPEPTPEPEPQPAPEEELPAGIDEDIGPYVGFWSELREQGFVFPSEPGPGPQVTPTLETDDGFSLGIDLGAAFHVATDGLLIAVDGVSIAVQEIVDGVKMAVDGLVGSTGSAAVSSTTHVEALTEIEAIGGLTGEADLVGSLTGELIPQGELSTEIPVMDMPAPALDAEADASSETSLSSSLTGDLGFGLP